MLRPSAFILRRERVAVNRPGSERQPIFLLRLSCCRSERRPKEQPDGHAQHRDNCPHVYPPLAVDVGALGKFGDSIRRQERAGEMLERPIGVVLLAGAFLTAGIVGLVAFLGVLPRSSATSPLAALFALMWCCTYLGTAVLTWRRSRLAPPAFLAAVGLLLFPALFLFPGSHLSVPLSVVIALVAFLGYRYLRRSPEHVD